MHSIQCHSIWLCILLLMVFRFEWLQTKLNVCVVQRLNTSALNFHVGFLLQLTFTLHSFEIYFMMHFRMNDFISSWLYTANRLIYGNL